MYLILEVYQFARDAAVAESWLMAQGTYLSCQDLGENLDETLALLKKHIAFERAVLTQEERFEALKKLTTLELRAIETSLESQKAKEQDRQRRINEAIKEFQPPPTPKMQKHEPVSESDAVLEAMTSQQQAASHRKSEHYDESGEHPSTSKPVGLEPHEGILSRKHEWESASKKASGRSWHELYVQLTEATLSAYKDQKHCKDKPSELYHHEAPLSITGAKVAPATDYTKRSNVFRLRLANGGEYLFQAKSESEMNEWITKLNNAAGGESDSAARSHTLPSQQHGTSESGEGHHGKKKFFTLGRKK